MITTQRLHARNLVSIYNSLDQQTSSTQHLTTDNHRPLSPPQVMQCSLVFCLALCVLAQYTLAREKKRSVSIRWYRIIQLELLNIIC